MATVAMSSAAFADNTETVVVTGSRIPVSSNLTSVSPIQSVTDQQFKIKGATDVSDMLNDMPQTFISSKSDFANANNPLTSPGGITTVNLRGLGPTRTLVLVNGRRLGVGDPNTGNPNAAPDIDQIPVALLQRVEVLTGGASSTYGSDAVAGVVNFIMKQDFEGVQIDAQYGVNWHDNTNSFARNLQQKAIDSGIQGPQSLAPDTVFDGRNIETSIMMGSNTADGKGNVTGYFSYRSADPVWMRNRDYSACQINIKSSAGCAGSANSNYFQATVGRDGTGALAQMVGDPYSIVGHSAVDWEAGPSNPPALFNSNAFETLSRQDTRYSGGFFGHYDISKYAKPYTEFQFMDDKSFQQIAPSAMFNGSNAFSADGSGNYYVNCDNPLMSADQVNKFCTQQNLLPSDYTELAVGRRNIEGGGRTSDYEHQSFRGVIGVKGDITDNWHYDAYGSYYYVTVDQNNGNYLSNQKVNKAIDVITGPALLADGHTPNPYAGQPECRSVYQNLDTACVPYNIFTEGGVTKAQTDYLATYGTSRGTLYEHVLEIDITGDLSPYGIKSPFANDGVQVSFGASNRKDHMTYAGDVAESSNDLMGFGGATVPINNGVTVTEEYGEIRIPLAQNLPFIQDLSMDGGIRFSAYSNHRRPTTWKLGLQWAPLDDIRFRASYDVAIRAPSILETYTPQSVTNTSDVSVDPCAPTVDDNKVKHAATATLAQCLRTGVTAAQYGDGLNTSQIIQCPSNQCATLTGGNTDLSPEKAKTFSVGLTVTPSLVPGLSASFDYYKIDVYNVIGTIPLETSLNNCLTSGTLCNNVKRTSSGTLFGTTINGGGYIIGNDMNIAFQNVSGIDIQTDYLTSLADIGLPDYGSLGFHMTGTYAATAKNRSLDGEPMYDCTGLFGNTCGSPLPRWRHHFRINWDTPWDVGLALTWRYYSGAENEKNSTQPVVSGTPDKLNSHLHDMSYLDLAVSYQVTKELELRAGMNNVFDFDPQIISNTITGSGSPNTYNSYDMLGRTMYVALTAKL